MFLSFFLFGWVGGKAGEETEQRKGIKVSEGVWVWRQDWVPITAPHCQGRLWDTLLNGVVPGIKEVNEGSCPYGGPLSLKKTS